MSNAFFVTGTDTAVGKTLIARALLKLARDAGQDTLGLKPVSAGCELRGDILANDDAWKLMHESSCKPSYEAVNPVALKEAMAPHIAATREGRTLAVDSLVKHCRPLIDGADFTVIEGAGGWDVPLNQTESMADLAAALGCPVILVVGVRLGCLNHSLLTARAIREHGLELAGWVANRIDPHMPVAEENIAALKDRLPCPLLGTVPWQDDVSIAGVAASLDISQLMD
ncbi:MAG: dethiobiotin synthase [Gammaproteobacteria bacterium]|jgi:dethiobiotin synthetase|nr:dethiobiotin synthase [Gammaproteobacteria bacterium]MDP6617462.1 dethiobiotin synthase [Gammaproteobacteria bacterium]MDP6695667.1 dethiobiotin synthase [Gammaproteobacteria bacterium]